MKTSAANTSPTRLALDALTVSLQWLQAALADEPADFDNQPLKLAIKQVREARKALRGHNPVDTSATLAAALDCQNLLSVAIRDDLVRAHVNHRGECVRRNTATFCCKKLRRSAGRMLPHAVKITHRSNYVSHLPGRGKRDVFRCRNRYDASNFTVGLLWRPSTERRSG